MASEPVVVGISICKKNYTHEFISESRVFTISVLSKDTPLEHVGRFVYKCGRDFDKFEGVAYRIGVTDAPRARPAHRQVTEHLLTPSSHTPTMH